MGDPPQVPWTAQAAISHRRLRARRSVAGSGHPQHQHVTVEDRWIAALWPKVRSFLPPAPATIVELGCGRFGGFVPRLRESGYSAVGVDPAAPDGNDYRRVEFE